MQRIFSATLFVLVLFASSVTCAQQPRSISVSGTVVNRIKPDGVTWTIRISTNDPILKSATENNNTLVEQILELRESLNVDPKDVQTSYLSISKVYFQDENRNQGDFRYYSVKRTVTLVQRSIDQYESTLEKLSALEDIQFSHSLFSSDYHAARRQTRIEAVKVAKEKAIEMAESVGATVGRVLVIEEAKPANERMQYSNAVTFRGEQATEDEISGAFAPGSISVRVSVNAQFELED